MQRVVGLGPRGHDTYTEYELTNCPFTWIENEAIWQFLWYRIHDPQSRQIEKCSCDTKNIHTWEEFRKQTGSGRPLWKLKNYFQEQLGPSLCNAFLADETKIELYFGLGMPLSSDFYNIIRKEGHLEVDSLGRINRFVGESGLHLASHRNYAATSDQDLMWDYLRRRVHCPRSGKLLHPTEIPPDFSLWKEFKESYKAPHTIQMLLKIFRDEMAPRIHLTDFDLNTKAKICFVLRIPVIPELFNELIKNATIAINDLRRITYYNPNGSNMNLSFDETILPEKPNNQNYKRHVFTEQEEIAMFTFVYHKVQDTKTKRIRRDKSVLNSKEIWAEFDLTNRVHRDPVTYMRRFKHIMLPVCYLARISKMMKMALHFALEIPVHEDFLKELRKTAIVELNREGCIIAYKERKKRLLSSASAHEFPDDVIDLDDDVPVPPKIQKPNDEPIELDDIDTPNVMAVSEINDSEIDFLLRNDEDGGGAENHGELIPEDELLMDENSVEQRAPETEDSAPEANGNQGSELTAPESSVVSASNSTEKIQTDIENLVLQEAEIADMKLEEPTGSELIPPESSESSEAAKINEESISAAPDCAKVETELLTSESTENRGSELIPCAPTSTGSGNIQEGSQIIAPESSEIAKDPIPNAPKSAEILDIITPESTENQGSELIPTSTESEKILEESPLKASELIPQESSEIAKNNQDPFSDAPESEEISDIKTPESTENQGSELILTSTGCENIQEESPLKAFELFAPESTENQGSELITSAPTSTASEKIQEESLLGDKVDMLIQALDSAEIAQESTENQRSELISMSGSENILEESLALESSEVAPESTEKPQESHSQESSESADLPEYTTAPNSPIVQDSSQDESFNNTVIYLGPALDSAPASSEFVLESLLEGEDHENFEIRELVENIIQKVETQQ